MRRLTLTGKRRRLDNEDSTLTEHHRHDVVKHFKPAHPDRPHILNFLADAISTYNSVIDSMREALLIYYPNGLDYLPNAIIDMDLNRLTPGEAMPHIESIIHRLHQCSATYASLFCDPDVPIELKHAISNSNNDLCWLLDEFSRHMHLKYQTRRPTYGFLYEDCFHPYGFDETQGVIEYSLSGLYSSALQVHQHTRIPITITYRDEGWGDGAIYDHRTIQTITGCDTVISAPASDLFNPAQMGTRLDAEGYRNILRGTNQTENGRYYPAVVPHDPANSGLIVIPGYSSTTPTKRPHIHTARMNHEKPLAQESYRRRQPTLGICGGMWTIAEALGGYVQNLSPARQAAHRGRMPGLNTQGRVINYSEKHDVLIRPNSTLDNMIGPYLPPSKRMSVSSVHWAHVTHLPPGFCVSAKLSQRPEELNSTGAVFEVEAIESNNTVGIQFHSEAAPDAANKAIIREMEKRGQYYFQHQQVLKEIRARAPIGGLFRQHDNNQTRDINNAIAHERQALLKEQLMTEINNLPKP